MAMPEGAGVLIAFIMIVLAVIVAFGVYQMWIEDKVQEAKLEAAVD
jgi:hypothetical protein